MNEAESRAEPRRSMWHHQIVPLLHDSIVSPPIDATPNPRLGARFGLANHIAPTSESLRFME